MDRRRFQEAAASQFSPRVLLWGARAAYVGPGLNLAPHHNATATIAIALERPFEYAVLGEAPAPARRTPWVLIPPNTHHHLRADGAIAFVYLDASGDDYPSLCALEDTEPRLVAVQSAIRTTLADTGGSPREHIRQILQALGVTTRIDVDPRVVAVVDELARRPQDFSSVARAASHAGLSTSRFQHLFRAAMGVPFRRYRLWSRMARVAHVLADGGNLTQAALEAGFASSAHFSAAFRTMFGLSPTQLLASGVELRIDRGGG